MTKQESANLIREECINQGLVLEEQIAYVIATADWETNHTLLPVVEAYWMDKEYRCNLHYAPYYGRGLVQLTWKDNYAKYEDILGVPLVEDPDLALDYKIALFILVHGFINGTFTGAKIRDYINDDITDYYNARRCINGTDSANEIANTAESIDHLIYV
jgi:hypothetical protein